MELREANLNPKLPLPLHVDAPDPVVDRSLLGLLVPDAMPAPVLNFDGIPFPGVGCSCAPPDTNGAVGLTQYVQMVNEGYQVFNKTTGASVLGPTAITAIWSGFGGVCQSNGSGDPVVLYDHLANRWLISQFAGTSIPTDECIAISTTSDATGTYNRYAFHLGSNFFDYPHLGVWPDGYYMAMNIYNSSGTALLGPQAFAFDRANMLTGAVATFVTPGITGGASEPSFLPSDLDGSILPTSGVGNPFVSFPGSGTYKVRLFHADFVTPGNTTFNLIGSPGAAGFTAICPSTRACVPELGAAAASAGVFAAVGFWPRHVPDVSAAITLTPARALQAAIVRGISILNFLFLAALTCSPGRSQDRRRQDVGISALRRTPRTCIPGVAGRVRNDGRWACSSSRGA